MALPNTGTATSSVEHDVFRDAISNALPTLAAEDMKECAGHQGYPVRPQFCNQQKQRSWNHWKPDSPAPSRVTGGHWGEDSWKHPGTKGPDKMLPTW